MINLNNITKAYNGQMVINNFTYQFPNNGLIVLFGESGCGKTTLLNIIAGIIQIDSGTIMGKTDSVGYITQDSHFVDYLTVEDNLRLCLLENKEDSIGDKLRWFGLWEQREQYPQTLSGGEKQRLAILQMILLNKKVVLLDEPTASLDPINKRKVFDILKDLKEEHLIILSSHDQVALEYADDIVNFHNLSIYNKKKEDTDCITVKNIGEEKAVKKRNLQIFMEKYYSYPRREKKSIQLLFIILILSFLCVGLIDLPRNKTQSNIQYIYKLNQLTLVDNGIDTSLYDKLTQDKDLLEIDLIYHLSVPDGIEDDTTISSNVSYNLTVKTLPFTKEAFELSDCIAFGDYFSKPEQVMLSYSKAEQYGAPVDIIGKTIEVEMFDNIYEMEVAGVFSEFNKFEQEYMRASQAYEEQWEDGIYINGEFTKRYIQDLNFVRRNIRTYILYYKDYSVMKQNYEDLVMHGYMVRPIDGWVNSNITSLFDAMFTILLPLVIVVIFTATLLYFQTNKIEMSHQKYIFSVYNYLGYSFREIQKCWIVGSLKQVIKVTIGALVIAIIIMIGLNMCNRRIVFVPFQIFSMNPVLLIVVIILLGMVTIVGAYVTMRQVKMLGYYAVLLEERDLL